MATVITLCAGIALFSKVRRFLAFQIPHRTHETMSVVSPVGGKQMSELALISAWYGELMSSQSTGAVNGASLQTCCAKGQVKKRWRAVSKALQCGQVACRAKPLRCKLAPRARAPLHSFQTKSFSFSEVDMDQIWRFQLNSSGTVGSNASRSVASMAA